VLEVHVEAPATKTPVVVWATHFDHRSNDAERVASAEAIRARALAAPQQPALLIGDLNDQPSSRTLTAVAADWARTNPQVLPTSPAPNPSRQIDYVLFRPAERWEALETRVLDEAVASDHRPIFAILELKAAR
jgi:endonuclease/exonuclease/phosphatase family metal-dependent hydrolase